MSKITNGLKKPTKQNARIAEIEKKFKEEGLLEEQILELKKEMDDLIQAKEYDERVEKKKKAVPKVKEPEKLNVAVFGWEKSGKTTICNYLQDQHGRCIVDLSQLLSYNVEHNTEAATQGSRIFRKVEIRNWKYNN